jgi:hypothetical protein
VVNLRPTFNISHFGDRASAERVQAEIDHSIKKALRNGLAEFD